MIKEISSVNNQYVKDLLSLKDKNTRNELKLFLPDFILIKLFKL